MKNSFISLMFGVVFSISGVVLAVESDEAGKAYDVGSFGEAAVVYQELIKDDPYSADLHYNLGNSYFRDDELGLAILNYEKALLLNPRHSDALHNLGYANSLLDTKMEDKRNWYIKSVEKILNYVTLPEILALTLLVLSLFLVGLISYLRGGGEFWGMQRKTIIVLLTLLILFIGGKYYQLEKRMPAIVLDSVVEVRYGPSINDQLLLNLGEGLKVFVTSSREHWSRIILVNGQTGWVQNHHIAEISV